jgi:hypothetical protein
MRNFPSIQLFDADVGRNASALLLSSPEAIAHKYRMLSHKQRQAIRCVIGTHYPFGSHAIFETSAKYFTIVRHPVDRAISSFYYLRRQSDLPIYPFIRDMTFEQYLHSEIGLDPFNHQVRVLSGCPELDMPLDPRGGRLSASAVEERHLEMAKRNIEDHFLTAAPFEALANLVGLLRLVYGWRLHRTVFTNRNITRGRPKLEEVSEGTRRHLENTNRFDIELYEWVKARFAHQIESLDFRYSRHLLWFNIANFATQEVARSAPAPLRKIAATAIAKMRAAPHSGGD